MPAAKPPKNSNAPVTLYAGKAAYRRAQACDLCGQRDVIAVGEKDRRGNALTSVVCTGCGLVSHENIPTVQEVHEYYATQYRADYHGQSTPAAHRVIRAWKTGKQTFARLAPFMKTGDKVFEIGAGLGLNLKAFELAGYDASGIEPTNDFRAFANKLHVQVRQGTIEDLKVAPEFDFVLLSHVIEHLRSPKTSLRTIAGLLRPGGRFYVECPNAGAPHVAPKKMFHFAHIYNFTHETLLATAQAAGFKLVKQFSNERNTNLMLLLELDSAASRSAKPTGIEGGCERTLARLTRYSTLTYHLRPWYLAHRLSRLASLHSDRLHANSRLEKIFAECDAHAKKKPGVKVPPTRKAA